MSEDAEAAALEHRPVEGEGRVGHEFLAHRGAGGVTSR